MDSIKVSDALLFAEQAFPQAPEELAQLLKVDVRYSPLNCDGWCLQLGNRSVIRINSDAHKVRQRFTLAHELGHLVLGVPSVIGEEMLDVPNLTNEERRVNNFASEILLPLNIAKSLVAEIPVTSTAIRKIATKSGVSELFVARRLASIAKKLGLKDGLVIFYVNNAFAWQWSNTIEMETHFASRLLDRCLEASPHLLRVPRDEEGDVLVASLVKNPFLNTITVFVQIVAEEDGLKELNEERIKDLEDFIFGDGKEFERSLQGCFGAVKIRVEGLTLDQGVDLFNLRYLHEEGR